MKFRATIIVRQEETILRSCETDFMGRLARDREYDSTDRKWRFGDIGSVRTSVLIANSTVKDKHETSTPFRQQATDYLDDARNALRRS